MTTVREMALEMEVRQLRLALYSLQRRTVDLGYDDFSADNEKVYKDARLMPPSIQMLPVLSLDATMENYEPRWQVLARAEFPERARYIYRHHVQVDFQNTREFAAAGLAHMLEIAHRKLAADLLAKKVEF